MLARLEAAFDAQREFVANASHELRTPLAIMRTEVDVTLADPQATGADLRRMADTVRAAIVRSEDIIDRLLVLAESERSSTRRPSTWSALVAEVVSRRTPAAEARGLTFALDLEPAPVEGDRALLERLVDNLVGNAVRYAHPTAWCASHRPAPRRRGAARRQLRRGDRPRRAAAPVRALLPARHVAQPRQRRLGPGPGDRRRGGRRPRRLVRGAGPAEGGLVVTVTLPVSARAEPAQR
jgi:hypothetical protein